MRRASVSIQAIGVINEDPTIRKVIIVCPASMRIPWRREMELDRPLSIGVIGVDNGSPHDLFSKNVVIIKYDRLNRDVSGIGRRSAQTHC
jgi:hypothetical protein